MMCDTNWCTFCDSAISPFSDSLYCSDECLKQDALMHHPMLGYDYSDLNGFPHTQQHQPQQQKLPAFVNRKPSIPTIENSASIKVPSLSPSLSSSISSFSSASDTMTFYPPKPRRLPSPINFMDQILMSS